MSSIDERIVAMRFQNGEFERGIATTSKSLAKFKQDLDLKGASQGLDGVGRAASNVNLDHIGDGVDRINKKFSLLGVIGATAVAKLTSSALSMGAGLISNVIDPILTGGRRRAGNIEHAKFMLEGLKVQWKDIVPYINHAVDGTAYGLDEAARAASSLVASGVEIPKMGYSLRAISGVAAMTGSEFSDISHIFTTVAGNGRLMASEMNRIGQRGINAWAPLADHIGVTEEAVRKMVSDGLVNFDTFAAAMDGAFGEQATKSNETYSGSLANVRAALARIGELPAAGRMEQLRQVFNALRPQINNVLSAMRPLLTAIQKFQKLSGKKTASFIEGIDLGWMKTFFRYITTSFNTVQMIFNKISAVAKDAWAEIFPSKGGGMNWLVRLAGAFDRLLKRLMPTEAQLEKIKNVFLAVFGAAKVVWEVITSLWSIFSSFMGVIGQVIGILWDFIKPLFESETAASDTAETLTDFFEMLITGMKDGVEPAIEFLDKMRDALQNLREGGSSGWAFFDNLYHSIKNFSALSRDNITGFFTNIGDSLSQISSGDIIGGIKKFFTDMFKDIDFGTIMGSAWDKVKEWFGILNDELSGFWVVMEPVGSGIGSIFRGIGDAVKSLLGLISEMDLDDVLEVADMALLLYIMVQVSKTIDSIKGVSDSLSGAFASIGKFFTSEGPLGMFLTDIQKTMKMNSRFDNILKMAAAIGILAGALWLIAQIPSDRLVASGIALGSIALGLAALVVGIDYLAKNMTPEQAANIQLITTALIKMSFAVGILAAAMWLLGQLSWSEIARGLTAVGGLVLSLVAITWVLSKNTKGMIGAAFAVNLFAAAIVALAGAVWLFGVMDHDTLVQGGIAVGIALGSLALAMTLMGSSKNLSSSLKAGVAIGIIVGSLFLLALAIKTFSAFEWDDIESGVTLIGWSLAFIGGLLIALNKFAPGALAGAGAVAIITGSLIAIAVALQVMSGLDADEADYNARLLLTTIGVMSLIAVAISKLKSVDGAVAVLILAASLAAVAAVFHIMSGLDSEKADHDARILMSAIMVLGIVALLLDKLDAKGGAVAVGILAAALSVVAIAFHIMAGIDPERAESHAWAMLSAIVVLGFVASLLDKLNVKNGAIGVAILSGALIGIAFAFSIMDRIDPERQMGNLTSLLALIGGLAGVALLLSKIDSKWGVAALVIMTAAIWVVAQSLSDLNDVPLDHLWGMVLAMGALIAIVGALAVIIAVVVGSNPIALAALVALALVIASLALVIYAVSGLLEAFAGLIEMAVYAFVTFTQNAEAFGVAIGVVAQAAADSSQHFWAMIGMAIGLGALGIAAILAGLGLMAMGVGLMLLTTGAVAFGGVSQLLVEALLMLVQGLADMAMYTPALIVVGAGLAIVGAGALLAGVGFVVLGLGLAAVGGAIMVISIGIGMLGPALESAIPALSALADVARENQDAILPLIGLAVGLAAFGAAAIVAGIGGMLLGGALMMIGAGFALASAFAEGGAESLMAALDILKPLWKDAIQLGIAAANIALMGAALLVFGVGSLAAAIGGALLAVAMLALMLVLPSFGKSVERFADSFEPAAEKMVQGIATMAAGIAGSTGLISSSIGVLTATITAGINTMSSAFRNLGEQSASAMGTGMAMGLLSASGLVIVSVLQIMQMAAMAASTASLMYLPIGIQAGLLLAAGLSSTAPQSMVAGRTVMTGFTTGIKTQLGSVKKSGVTVATSFVDGVKSANPAVQTAGRNVTTALTRGISMQIPTAKTKATQGGLEIGLALAQGTANGVNNNAYRVNAAIRSMATNAVQQAKNALDVKSPSRVFTWIGKMLPEGMAQGVRKGEADVVDATGSMGMAAIRAARSAMSSVGDYLIVDGDLNPTITPSLDLSEVRRGTSEIYSMLATRPIHATVTSSMAQNYAQDVDRGKELSAAQGASGRGDVTFVQNNHSPRALSTTELYRKGRSLVAKASKVIVKED